MKKMIILMAGLFMMFCISSSANAYSITPVDSDWWGNETANLDAGKISAIVLEDYGFVDVSELSLPTELLCELYKQDVPKDENSIVPDVGPFASNYTTTFFNSEFDPSDALIKYVEGPYINTDPIYLFVKDGGQVPAWYLFDISDWNGTDDLSLLGFWPLQGAISHVAIYGPCTSVPEPATLLLLGFSLVGLAGASRKFKK